MPLQRIVDVRGSLAEIFSQRRPPAQAPLQWNLVRSRPRTLRGMHVHVDRADYIVVLAGRMHIGLRDLRGLSASLGCTAMVEIDAEHPRAVEIPVGVMHGFFSPDGGVHAYGLSAYWRPNTDIGCRWDDPNLGLDWREQRPLVIERDLRLGSLNDLMARENTFAGMAA